MAKKVLSVCCNAMVGVSNFDEKLRCSKCRKELEKENTYFEHDNVDDDGKTAASGE